MLTLVEVCELKCRGNICQFVLLMIGLSSQMKKLETKMATMNEEKDKRIVELQAHNNDLFNKLEEFEERYNNQLDVSRSLLLFLLQRLGDKGLIVIGTFGGKFWPQILISIEINILQV